MANEISTTDDFDAQLDEILEFIKKDNNLRALKFKNELFEKIYSLDFMPFKWRKNLDLNNENIRDLIFKGYVIPYYVGEKQIIVLGIYKHNLPKIRI